MAASLKTFRATLPAEDSELVICPPDCQEDHDAKWGQGGGTLRASAQEKPTAAKSTRREEANMAAKTPKPLSAATVKTYKSQGKALFATRDGAVFSSKEDRRAYRAAQKAAA